ncbi:Hsp90 cochaperone shq1 [Globomyces sp. JEL0801]|nr:Hsp90 cochaperone shq1 [Globomyces sp. JEL0801]
MLTPKFELEQEDDFIVIRIHCPYIKAQNVEIDISETNFRFYCNPYFLRLNFPHQLIENGKEKSSYNIDTGYIILHIPKETPGLYFEDLHLLTKLMDIKPSDKISQKPLIEVIGPSTESNVQTGENDMEEDEMDWSYEQSLPILQDGNTAKYGFNHSYQGYGISLQQIAHDIIDIRDIDSSTITSRREDRIAIEEIHFDKEHYMYDFIVNEEIKLLIDYIPDTWKYLNKLQKLKKTDQTATLDSLISFSESEREVLTNLKNKEYTTMEISVYLGLVDLLFAYCYNKRTTEGEDTVESPWTLSKLSGTLSSFETFTSLEEALSCNLRRALTFPLYRSFILCEKVFSDVVVLFKLGKLAILQALLQIKILFNTHDVLYLMNQIYINDYCVWIQQCSDKRIKSLASELNHFKFTKELCGWNLQELETLAQETADTEE